MAFVARLLCVYEHRNGNRKHSGGRRRRPRRIFRGGGALWQHWRSRAIPRLRLPLLNPTTTNEQKSLLYQLGLDLPERFQLNRKCSADPAVA
jgi:hypothetical protein